MGEILAFIAARLDEDEARAPRISFFIEEHPEVYDKDPTIQARRRQRDRVLREVAAHRAILHECQVAIQDRDTARERRDDTMELYFELKVRALVFAVETLAGIWSDHEAYREEWRT